MPDFKSRLNNRVWLERTQQSDPFTPAAIQKCICQRFKSSAPTGRGAVDVLDPDLYPCFWMPAAIDEASQINRRLARLSQENKRTVSFEPIEMHNKTDRNRARVFGP